MLSKIPYGHQYIDQDDIKEVVKVLKADWLTCGPKVLEFEKKLASFCKAKYAVALSSGTAALHAAYYAASIQKGDEVLTTPLTFSATSMAFCYLGARPVFCDVDENLNLDPKEIEKKITKRTKAIAVVDFAGHPAKLDEIKKIAKKHHLLLIEDACHALGSAYKGKKIGGVSDLTVFSFHPVKTVTTGEGGAVLTNNKTFYERMKRFRHHGIEKKNLWLYEVKDIGFNYRITDFQCALGISQLKKLNKFIQRRREIVKMYEKAFKGIKDLILLKEKPYVKSAWHIWPIQVKKNRKKVFEALRKKGILVQVHYIPLHFQPFYQKRFGYRKGDFPKVEAYYKRAITLPLFPAMTNNDVNRVIGSLKQVL